MNEAEETGCARNLLWQVFQFQDKQEKIFSGGNAA